MGYKKVITRRLFMSNKVEGRTVKHTGNANVSIALTFVKICAVAVALGALLSDVVYMFK